MKYKNEVIKKLALYLLQKTYLDYYQSTKIIRSVINNIDSEDLTGYMVNNHMLGHHHEQKIIRFNEKYKAAE